MSGRIKCRITFRGMYLEVRTPELCKLEHKKPTRIVMTDSAPDNYWKAEYPKYAKHYTPEEWEEYNTNPVGWCIKELNNANSDIRYNAVDILRGACPDAEEAIVPLTKVLNDPDPQVRAQTAFAFIDFGHYFKHKTVAAIQPLIQTLNDQDAGIRSLAAQALGAIGSAAKDALPALSELESDVDEEVRDAAKNAKQSIASDL